MEVVERGEANEGLGRELVVVEVEALEVGAAG